MLGNTFFFWLGYFTVVHKEFLVYHLSAIMRSNPVGCWMYSRTHIIGHQLCHLLSLSHFILMVTLSVVASILHLQIKNPIITNNLYKVSISDEIRIQIKVLVELLKVAMPRFASAHALFRAAFPGTSTMGFIIYNNFLPLLPLFVPRFMHIDGQNKDLLSTISKCLLYGIIDGYQFVLFSPRYIFFVFFSLLCLVKVIK